MELVEDFIDVLTGDVSVIPRERDRQTSTRRVVSAQLPCAGHRRGDSSPTGTRPSLRSRVRSGCFPVVRSSTSCSTPRPLRPRRRSRNLDDHFAERATLTNVGKSLRYLFERERAIDMDPDLAGHAPLSERLEVLRPCLHREHSESATGQ